MNFTKDYLISFITDNSIDIRFGPKSIVIPGTELSKFAVADLPIPDGMKVSNLDVPMDELVKYEVDRKENPDTPKPLKALCISKSLPATPEALANKLDSILESK